MDDAGSYGFQRRHLTIIHGEVGVSSEEVSEPVVNIGCVRSILETVCKIDMIAAVVEPVGRKANWSVNVSNDGSERKAG